MDILKKIYLKSSDSSDREHLFNFMEEVLIQKKFPAPYDNELFIEISGESGDGKSGIKAVEALTSFMKSL